MPPAGRAAASTTIGDIEIISLWDGTLKASVDTIRDLDPRETRRLLDEAAQSTGADPLLLPVLAFLVRSSEGLALVDTGSGRTKGPTMGFLADSLAAVGVSPSQIGAVLLTHLHMDHIGGLLNETGRPAFANAELLVHRAEAAYFLETPTEDLDARSARHVSAQRSAVEAYLPRVRRVADGEGLQGITARLAPGHTPGHTVWHIASAGHSALVIGDVVHMAAIQLPRPAVPMIYDVDPAQAAETRLDLLAGLARDATVVAGAHLPDGGIGRIVRKEDGYGFEPVD